MAVGKNMFANFEYVLCGKHNQTSIKPSIHIRHVCVLYRNLRNLFKLIFMTCVSCIIFIFYLVNCTSYTFFFFQLVSPAVFEKHQQKSLKEVQATSKNSFHCKSPDCQGWCFISDNINSFKCPVCKRLNCITCQVMCYSG